MCQIGEPACLRYPLGAARRGRRLVNKESNTCLPWRRCHSVLLDEWGSPRRPKLFKLFQSGHMRRTGTDMNLNTRTDIASSPIRIPIPKRVSPPSCRSLVDPIAYPLFSSRKPSLLDLFNSVQRRSLPCWASMKPVSSTAGMVNTPSQSGSSLNTQLTKSCFAVAFLPCNVPPKSPVITVLLPLHDDQATSVSRILRALLFYICLFCLSVPRSAVVSFSVFTNGSPYNVPVGSTPVVHNTRIITDHTERELFVQNHR